MREIDKTLRLLLNHLVDFPDHVDIISTVTENTAIYEIKVHDKDLGKVLGKKGIHADALRTILAAIYGKHRKKLHLQVLDPSKSKK